MRESIGGTWLLGIVMVFMMIFIAFVSISINYSKAFKLKSSMVTIVEEYQGVNAETIKKLNKEISANGYVNKGNCANNKFDGYISVLDGVATPNGTGKQNYCIYREYKQSDKNGENRYYYTVSVFFNISLPILGDIFTFRVSGETNPVYETVKAKNELFDIQRL